ncbi:MAG: hypothetical protein WA919_08945 [Coleofasciculaceae cyanobacterium]
MLITFGLFCLLVPAVVATRQEATKQDQVDAVGAFFLGFPAVAWGGWLAWGLHHQAQQKVRERLHAAFYRLLTEGKGQITVMRFAMEANLPVAVAKKYLDEKATEFDATFDVSEEGSILYNFLL